MSTNGKTGKSRANEMTAAGNDGKGSALFSTVAAAAFLALGICARVPFRSVAE